MKVQKNPDKNPRVLFNAILLKRDVLHMNFNFFGRMMGPATPLILVVFVLFAIVGCSQRDLSSAHAPTHASEPVVAAIASRLQCIQRGVASWYGTHMKGRLTASGEKYDPKALTAASRKFPLGTELNVINLKNNQDVTVTVNDRGPYSGERIIDMSVAAAHELGMEEAGLAQVCVQNMEQADDRAVSGTS
jgi:rare lipoprotein A (peptidoglycan hydrolase)